MIGGGPLIATGLRYVDPKTGRSAWMEGSQFIAFIRDEVAREGERRKKADEVLMRATGKFIAAERDNLAQKVRDRLDDIVTELDALRAENAALRAELDQFRDLFVGDAPAPQPAFAEATADRLEAAE